MIRMEKYGFIIENILKYKTNFSLTFISYDLNRMKQWIKKIKIKKQQQKEGPKRLSNISLWGKPRERASVLQPWNANKYLTRSLLVSHYQVKNKQKPTIILITRLFILVKKNLLLTPVFFLFFVFLSSSLFLRYSVVLLWQKLVIFYCKDYQDISIVGIFIRVHFKKPNI